MKKIIIIVILCLSSTHLFAESPDSAKFVTNYAEKVRPFIEEKMSTMLWNSGVGKETADIFINDQAIGMAKCHLYSIDIFPEPVKMVQIESVKSGDSLLESSNKSNAFLSKLIENGDISEAMIAEIVQQMNERLQSCSARMMSELQNEYKF